MANTRQAKINEARILYIHATGVTSEIIKNMVLAGIRACVCDERLFTAALALRTPSFFLSNTSPCEQETKSDEVAATKRFKKGLVSVAETIRAPIEELNPLLGQCTTINKSVDELNEDDLKNFTVVVASLIVPSQASRLSKIVTDAGNSFILVDTFGMDGAAIIDLGHGFSYRPERGKELLHPIELTPYKSLFSILNESKLQDATNKFFKAGPPSPWMKYRMNLHYMEHQQCWPQNDEVVDPKRYKQIIRDWVASDSPDLLVHPMVNDDSNLDATARNATCQMPPVCSVVGGMVGNEIIKAISRKGEPANNT
jgi:ubiquitin-like 1-activating enzyme E1 A